VNRKTGVVCPFVGQAFRVARQSPKRRTVVSVMRITVHARGHLYDEIHIRSSLNCRSVRRNKIGRYFRDAWRPSFRYSNARLVVNRGVLFDWLLRSTRKRLCIYLYTRARNDWFTRGEFETGDAGLLLLSTICPRYAVNRHRRTSYRKFSGSLPRFIATINRPGRRPARLFTLALIMNGIANDIVKVTGGPRPTVSVSRSVVARI